MQAIQHPLVSIVVVTYNSSKYVLETLESSKNQTYQHIELIITDDYSTDNTVNLCKQWILENENRFVRFEVITSNRNTGISANCNRGLKLAQGEWIKFIAGDDILLNDCIENNVNYINSNSSVSFLFSDMIFINEKSEIIARPINYTIKRDHFLLSAKEQYIELLSNGNFIFAPTSFINKNILKLLSGFDERINNMEDYPLWIRATNGGYKLHFLSIFTVKYRIRSSSLTNTNQKYFRGMWRQVFFYYRSNFLFFNDFHQWYYILISHFLQNPKLHYLKFLKFFSFKYLYNKVLQKKSKLWIKER